MWAPVLTLAAASQVTEDVPALRPAAVVDLRTREGVDLVAGAWRYHDAAIVEVDHRAPGPISEYPVWVPDGYLLFSEPNANRIYRWSPDGQVSVYRTKSGYADPDIGEYRQPGSNGLALEDGVVLSTDPFFGLPGFADDPEKDLPFSGVYALVDGELRLLTSDLVGPNGIALSPDEATLYVGNWDEARRIVMAYDLAPDASVSNARVLFDMTDAPGEDAIDGVKVDRLGNLYVSGPGGLWILSPTGAHLGTIRTPVHVHNMAWGDADGRTLYLCARDELYRMRLEVEGARSPLAATGAGR